MEVLICVFAVGVAIVGGIYLWTFTKKVRSGLQVFDLSKLILAGVVIGGITPLYSNDAKEINLYVIIAGVVSTVLLAWIANKILK